MKIQWTDLAIERVYDIASFIALDSVNQAEIWVNKVFDKADTLVTHYRRYRKVEESSNPNHREIVFGNYRIIYKITTATIFILTVRHFKQILPEDDLKSSP